MSTQRSRLFYALWAWYFRFETMRDVPCLQHRLPENRNQYQSKNSIHCESVQARVIAYSDDYDKTANNLLLSLESICSIIVENAMLKISSHFVSPVYIREKSKTITYTCCTNKLISLLCAMSL